MLLFIINGDSRRVSRKHHIRQLWDSISEKLKVKKGLFNIDWRRFDDEAMLLFPEIAFQSLNNDNIWKIVIHGWRYESSKRKDWLGLSASIWFEQLAKHFISPEDISYLNGSINPDRLKPFLVEDEKNDLIMIQIDEKTYQVRTDGIGQFRDQIEVTNDVIQKLKQAQQRNDFLKYEAIGDNKDKANGVIQLIEPSQGISVISDVDDTIKISEVLDKVRLLANTFIHPFKAVPGMSELYQKWHLNNNCTFHYLSGMPDQLYTITQEFINTEKFPDGSFHMRHFSWARESLFQFLHSEATITHKLTYLRFFISNTKRTFVLVGDSGEKDPEIYATVTKENPDRIQAIFIRAIKGEAFDDKRFLTVFDGIPKEKWQIFNDPAQVPFDLSKLSRSSTR